MFLCFAEANSFAEPPFTAGHAARSFVHKEKIFEDRHKTHDLCTKVVHRCLQCVFLGYDMLGLSYCQ